MVVDWALTALFAALALPCVRRLVRLDYGRLGPGIRHGDLAELLLVVAMVAMLSPVGGPIPAAGWQAVLALTTGWFAAAWWRGRSGCAHHALSAAAMFYMVTAMPHAGMDHGPWLTMSTMDSRLALPLIAVVAAGYFVVDAVWSGVLAVRGSAVAAGWPGRSSVRGPSVVQGKRSLVGGASVAGARWPLMGGAVVRGPSVVRRERSPVGGPSVVAAGWPLMGAAVVRRSPVAGARWLSMGGAVVRGPSVVAAGSRRPVLRGTPGAVAAALPDSGHASRAVCRAVMGAGMGYLLLASAL